MSVKDEMNQVAGELLDSVWLGIRVAVAIITCVAVIGCTLRVTEIIKPRGEIHDTGN